MARGASTLQPQAQLAASAGVAAAPVPGESQTSSALRRLLVSGSDMN